jgi:kumamolisin
MERTHDPVAGSTRRPLPGAIATGPANTHAVIEVSVKVRRKKAMPPLTGRPEEILSRQKLADEYGANPQDIDTVAHAFTALGLSVVDTNVATRTVRLRGSVGDMEQAFQVKLFNYSHASGNYRGRVGAVNVPTELRDIVQGVFGLDNRQVARRRRQPPRNPQHQHGHQASVPAAWYLPSDLAAHYDFPPGDGSGQTVGLLEFGGGYFPSDLKAFCSLAKIPEPPKVIPISTDGTHTDSRDGAEGEVMLDIEVVAGVCPKANIAVYFAQWSEHGWITALDAAVQDQTNDPSVLSVSWGNAEDTDIWTQQAMTQINETLQDAARIGVTVCIAAGDDGSSDAVADGHAHADFPSSSPFVLAVGGTTIPRKGTKKPDVAWKEGDGLRSDNGGSTGGGVSAVFPRPVWQQAIKIAPVNPGAIEGRCIPDLAANADWTASPYLLYVDGQPQPNGGTSAASPLVASLLARINAARPAGKRVGYVTPVLYQSLPKSQLTVGAAACTDVVSGDNITDKIGGFRAGPGFDAVSGWGTPNGVKLEQALAQVLG